MKRMLIVGGSVGAVILLVLTMFPTIVCAQTLKVTQINVSSADKMVDEKSKSQIWNNFLEKRLYPEGPPGSIADLLFVIIMLIFTIIYSFFNP